MVRAGVVEHPSCWRWGGYMEIQKPPQRYRVIDIEALAKLLGFNDKHRLQEKHRDWVQSVLDAADYDRDAAWSTSLAVGSADYIKSVQADLGITARYRTCVHEGDKNLLREQKVNYKLDFDDKSMV